MVVTSDAATATPDGCNSNQRHPKGKQNLQLAKQLPQGEADATEHGPSLGTPGSSSTHATGTSASASTRASRWWAPPALRAGHDDVMQGLMVHLAQPLGHRLHRRAPAVQQQPTQIALPAGGLIGAGSDAKKSSAKASSRRGSWPASAGVRPPTAALCAWTGGRSITWWWGLWRRVTSAGSAGARCRSGTAGSRRAAAWGPRSRRRTTARRAPARPGTRTADTRR